MPPPTTLYNEIIDRHRFCALNDMRGPGEWPYTTTLRYAHLAPEFKRKAVEVLDEAREAALSGAKVVVLVR